MSLNTSQLRDKLEDDWIKIELPKVMDEHFQDITDVKVRFYKQYTTETVVILTKKPNQITKISTY